jgi:hypothetical protein
MKWRAAALVVAVGAGSTSLGCLSAASALPALLPSGSGLDPATEIAQVDETPVTRSSVNHWLRIANAVAPGKHRGRGCQLPGPGSPRYERERDQTAKALITARWIKKEAIERGIGVTAREVRRHREKIKREFYENRREYERDLRESCQRQADVDFKVKLDLLGTKIRHQVLKGVAGEKERMHVLDQFLSDFRAKWRARTVCAEDFLVSYCSNGPPLA